jgi:hypothetical protein
MTMVAACEKKVAVYELRTALLSLSLVCKRRSLFSFNFWPFSVSEIKSRFPSLQNQVIVKLLFIRVYGARSMAWWTV